MSTNRYPDGWNESRVRSLISHYDAQTEDEAVAEDEAAYENPDSAFVEIPKQLLSSVRDLLSKKTG